MNPENSKKLVESFPEFWKHSDNLHSSLMAFGFECGDGWYNILFDLFTKIQEAYNEWPEEVREEFFIIQVKEKWGGLRVYPSHYEGSVDDFIQEAENRSFETCEQCGAPGKTRKGGWVQTLCDEHSDGREAYQQRKDGTWF